MALHFERGVARSAENHDGDCYNIYYYSEGIHSKLFFWRRCLLPLSQIAGENVVAQWSNEI